MNDKLRRTLNRLPDYSDHSLLEEVKRVSEILCSVDFTIGEFEKYSRCSYAVIKKRFGGLAKAVEKAGIGDRNFNRNVSEQELLDELERIWLLVLEREGRRPYREDLSKYQSKYSAGPYYARWGNWVSACEAVLNRADPTTSSPTPDIVDTEEGANSKRYYKRSIPLRLRWAVFQRDNFICVRCGRSPATHSGVSLHCDHIEPESKGGPTTEENLQTLCDSCNLGKGAT